MNYVYYKTIKNTKYIKQFKIYITKNIYNFEKIIQIYNIKNIKYINNEIYYSPPSSSVPKRFKRQVHHFYLSVHCFKES